MKQSAVILANGLFDSVFAKTTHGLIRGPSRYEILGVIDPSYTGMDVGAVLDGQNRGILFYPCVSEALQDVQPTHCVVGVATVGGTLPPPLKEDLLTAASAGLHLVNGLHQLLSDDDDLMKISSVEIIDLRKPRPASELHFWTGEIFSIPTPRVAILGMDCAIGKRTTAMLMQKEFMHQNLDAQVIYTGQTGWLQGLKYGFIFDATLNDFVSGELEHAIVTCDRETSPDIILLEGQSALQNPAGPAGSELICSAQSAGVILQHAPERTHFEDFEHLDGCSLPSLSDEIELIRLLGSEVWGISLFTQDLTDRQSIDIAQQLQIEHQIPVVRPLEDGVIGLINEIKQKLSL